MVYVNLSDKIGKYSQYVLTHDHKLVLFYPVNRLLSMKDIKPEWFVSYFPGGYVGMNTYLSLHDASSAIIKNGKPASCIMVLTLNLREFCRSTDAKVSEFIDALVFEKTRMMITIEQKNGLQAAMCKIFDYDVVKFLEHKETFYNYPKSPDRKSSLWRELASSCRIVFKN